MAVIATVATTSLSAPPSQENKLSKNSSSNPTRDSTREVVSLEEKLRDQEHDDCQDRNIRIVIQNSQGDKKTVPVKEFSQYREKGYKLVEADYEVGKCSREIAEK
ncbi:hypothetical protein [Mycoplasma wenyonii]|uniref:hypothetical protein n=1 Tax=Mycoplasma wenyonii TaxID=65123 RepID=UPI0011BD1906|nr:hypothetical protein [Mycoplasma wenyonii]